MSFDDEMFKVYRGKVHPFEMQQNKVDVARIKEASAPRDGQPWTDGEIVTLIFTQPPITNDEIATQFQREPGAINAVKSYISKAILKPEYFREPDGTIKSKYGIVRRIYRLLDEHGVREWPSENQKALARLLPGTKTRHRRKAAYLAKNRSG
jgi:hypothetical protein